MRLVELLRHVILLKMPTVANVKLARRWIKDNKLGDIDLTMGEKVSTHVEGFSRRIKGCLGGTEM